MNDEGRGTRDEGRRGAIDGISGFTLIETVITLVVLSIAAVGVLSVFIIGIKGSADPLLANQGVQLAQGELDTVIDIKTASGFSTAALATGTGQVCRTNAAMLAGFTCSLDICFVAAGTLDDTTNCNAPPTPYKRVAATITNTGTGQSVAAVTLLANY